MTDVAPKATRVEDDRGQFLGWSVQWAGLSAGQAGAPARLVGQASVQITGDFGVGGACRIEGSNDGVVYAPLHDSLGYYLDANVATLQQLREVVVSVRPVVRGGDDTTSLTVTIFSPRAS